MKITIFITHNRNKVTIKEILDGIEFDDMGISEKDSCDINDMESVSISFSDIFGEQQYSEGPVGDVAMILLCAFQELESKHKGIAEFYSLIDKIYVTGIVVDVDNESGYILLERKHN